MCRAKYVPCCGDVPPYQVITLFLHASEYILYLSQSQVGDSYISIYPLVIQDDYWTHCPLKWLIQNDVFPKPCQTSPDVSSTKSPWKIIIKSPQPVNMITIFIIYELLHSYWTSRPFFETPSGVIKHGWQWKMDHLIIGDVLYWDPPISNHWNRWVSRYKPPISSGFPAISSEFPAYHVWHRRVYRCFSVASQGNSWMSLSSIPTTPGGAKNVQWRSGIFHQETWLASG